MSQQKFPFPGTRKLRNQGANVRSAPGGGAAEAYAAISQKPLVTNPLVANWAFRPRGWKWSREEAIIHRFCCLAITHSRCNLKPIELIGFVGQLRAWSCEDVLKKR
jgi:hypothetical protein